MKQLPAGSKSSPIVISDDEDDLEFVSGQLLQLDSLSPSSSVRVSHLPSTKKPPRNRARNVEKRNSVGKNVAPGAEPSKSRKRKREQSNTRHNASGSNQIACTQSAAGNGTMTKNKRAKQQERTSRFQRESNARRQVFGDPDAFEQNLDPYTTTFPSIYSMNSPIPSDLFSGGLSMDASQPSFSSSEWVNSMARAAEPPNPIQNVSNYSWEYSATTSWISPPAPAPPPPQPYTPDQPNVASSAQPSSSSSTSLPPKPVTSTTSNSTINSLPKKPPSTNTIGMPKERDPDGKRGGFKISHSTVFDSQSHVTYPHTPDPSRTLIIEQLPKSCRGPQWIKSWAKSASGSQPVFYAIDSSSAKALLEFSSITLAEKAWRSPKLGKGIASLSPAELKGKSREDLIRVWWYRVPLPEVVFTRKELEEGEIEDEDDMIDGRKESKKEKKVRLAKLAKEAKAKKKENAQAAAVALAKEKQAQSIAASEGSTAPPPYSSIADDSSGAMSMSPSLQTMYTPTSYGSSVPAPIPWSSVTGVPPFTPALLSGPLSTTHISALPSMPSQYEMHVQWREPHPIASPEPPPSLTTSFSMNDFDDSVYATDGALKHEEVMDFDEADMEISSPTALTSTTIMPTHSDDASPEVPAPPTSEESSTSMHSDVLSSTSALTVNELSASTVGQPEIASHRNLPALIPTPANNLMSHVQNTAMSSSGSSTPLPTPSEPRAMKNAPREPTFTKRSLLARQKELEERIARTKMELERSANASRTNTVTTESGANAIAEQQAAILPNFASSTSSSSTIEGLPEMGLTKQAIEDNLRRLVVMSQKKRQMAVVADIPTPTVSSMAPSSRAKSPIDSVTLLTSLASSVDVTTRPDSAGDSVLGTPPPLTVDSALDDLAVSFIKESIQTIKPASRSSSPSVPAPVPKRPMLQSQASESSVDLAAKRKQLEYQIAETKRLMNLLAVAGTKQERDFIMSRIRTISRAVAGEDSPSPTSTESPAPSPALAPKYPSFLVQPIEPVRRLWPDCVIDGGILIVSDDEDEDGED